MVVRMPQFQTLDYGRAMQTQQAIEHGRYRNEITGMAVEEQRNILERRAEAQKVREQFERIPDQISGLRREGLFDEAQQLQESYMKQAAAEIDMIKAMRNGIDETNWKTVRQQMIESGGMLGESIPVEYDPNWLRGQEQAKKGNFQKLTRQWAEEGALMNQDIIAQDGEVLWQGTPYAKPATDEGGGSKFKWTASDANTMQRLAGALYGTLWDPASQTFQGLNKTQQLEAAQIAEEGSKIYQKAQGSLTHQEAINEAARNLQGGQGGPITIPQQSPSRIRPVSNPLNLPLNRSG